MFKDPERMSTSVHIMAIVGGISIGLAMVAVFLYFTYSRLKYDRRPPRLRYT